MLVLLYSTLQHSADSILEARVILFRDDPAYSQNEEPGVAKRWAAKVGYI